MESLTFCGGFFIDSTMVFIPVTYVIYDGEYYKAGFATNLFNRLSILKSNNPRKIDVIYVYRGRVAERWYHRALKNFHHSGEWFKCDMATIDAIHQELLCDVIDVPKWTLDYPLANKDIHGGQVQFGSKALLRSMEQYLGIPEPPKVKKPKAYIEDKRDINDYVPF